MRMFGHVLAAVALAFGVAAPTFAGADKPLVIESAKIKQLPASTTLQVNASGTGAASINIPHGTAPTSPANGDCWTTTAGFYCQIAGSTVGPMGAGSAGTVTTTGSPASGNLAKFSGSTSVTSGDLSGDVTTSGTLATTLATSGVTAGSYTSANITVDGKGRVTAAANGTGGGGGTPGGSNGQIEYNNAGALGGFTLAGDCTFSVPNITCTKTSGTAFGTFATQNFATPPAIGATTPNSVKATTLTDTTISGSTQCIYADSVGLLHGTGSSCGSGGSSIATPGTIADLVFWYESGNILASSGAGVPVLGNLSPAYGGLIGVPTGTGSTTGGATVDSGTLNGFTVINTAGTSAGRYSLIAAATSAQVLQNATIFAVFKPNAVSATAQTFISGNANALQFRFSSSGLELLQAGTASIGVSSSVPVSGTWYQANATYAAGTGAYAFRLARATAGSGTNAKTISQNSFAIFWNGANSSEDCNSKIAALIVYNRVLTGTEISNVESYLNSKYGV